MSDFSDEALLDFDSSNYAEWDRATADRLLVEEPALYRNHLAIARWLDQWAARAAGSEKGWDDGFQQALHEVIAHLRQGDFVPGRAMYEEH